MLGTAGTITAMRDCRVTRPRGRFFMMMAALALMSGGFVAATGDARRTVSTTPQGFAEAVRRAEDLPRLRSLLVSWRGELALERYFNGARANRLANIKSASKSVLSALVGIAIDQGDIASVREPVATFFPEVLGSDREAAKQQITIEDLLTMRSGLASTSGRHYGAWVLSRHWVRHALSRPLEDSPGTSMNYSTGNSHLLSAILTQATNRSTWRFAQDVLARPLGFTIARWPQDPQGIYFGGNDMLMTPRQMVAFGELYLNRGHRNGQQIVSTDWVQTSIIPRTRSLRWSGRLTATAGGSTRWQGTTPSSLGASAGSTSLSCPSSTSSSPPRRRPPSALIDAITDACCSPWSSTSSSIALPA